MSKCSITANAGGLVVKTPYSPRFVGRIKGLPSNDRKFDPATKSWVVAPKWGDTVKSWIDDEFGEAVVLPATATSGGIQRLQMRVLYVGTCKDRGTQEPSAFGFVDGGWNIVFSQSVLQAWFGGNRADGYTLYANLGISPDVDASAIKSAYRRMALQWHPDQCREPDAAEVFLKIQAAYEVLSNQEKRARYDAGLKLESSLGRGHQSTRARSGTYRPPLRCGIITMVGEYHVGRFYAQEIVSWSDITNQYGQTLVVSWPYGWDHFVEMWV